MQIRIYQRLVCGVWSPNSIEHKFLKDETNSRRELPWCGHLPEESVLSLQFKLQLQFASKPIPEGRAAIEEGVEPSASSAQSGFKKPVLDLRHQ